MLRNVFFVDCNFFVGCKGFLFFVFEILIWFGYFKLYKLLFFGSKGCLGVWFFLGCIIIILFMGV